MDCRTELALSKSFKGDTYQDYALKLIHIENSSLDTIRTLHQTIKTLRTALYKSKSELSLLKDRAHDDEAYAKTIEVLALENHVLKNKIVDSGLVKNVEQNLNVSEKKLNVSEVEDKMSAGEKTDSDGNQTDDTLTDVKGSDFDDVFELEDNVDKVVGATQTEDQSSDSSRKSSMDDIDEDMTESENKENLDSNENDLSGTVLDNVSEDSRLNDARTLESEESEEVDEVEFIFTNDDSVKLDNETLVKIEENESFPLNPTITHSVFVETDISKCGVLEEDEEDAVGARNLVSNIRRNTSPNPLIHRPYLHKEGLNSSKHLGHRHSVKFAKEVSNIRPICDENSSLEKQDGETQTEITAIPVHWKSESYLSHSKISQNFTTLPSKFSIPNEQIVKKAPPRKYSLRLCEKTQEARRVLLSDINFTSMVPELSRSVDHLCQEATANVADLYKNYPRAFSYMKNPDMSLYSSQTPCDCSSRQASWEYSNFSIPSTPSAIDITEPKKRPLLVRPSSSSLDTNWQKQGKLWCGTSATSPTLYRRSKSVPFNSNLKPFSEFSSSSYLNSGQITPHSTSRIFQKNKRLTRKHVAFSGSVPDLRSSVDTEDSTDSLIDESEHYLRRSIDSMSIEGGDPYVMRGRTLRRNSAPVDSIHGFLKSSGSFYPFTPKTATDLKPNHYVKVIIPNGRVVCGKVKYVGPVPSQGDTYVGVALNQDEGNCDGSYLGRRFFDCEMNKGIFVPFKKVILAWNTG